MFQIEGIKISTAVKVLNQFPKKTVIFTLS